MSLAETIRRIEAERLAEAQAAIDAGWTPDDHPEKCCPADKPLPRTIKTPAERRTWCLVRASNAELHVKRLERLAARLESDLTPTRRADFGEINIGMSKRAKSLDSAVTKAAQLIKARTAIETHTTRAAHWRRKASDIERQE